MANCGLRHHCCVNFLVELLPVALLQESISRRQILNLFELQFLVNALACMPLRFLAIRQERLR